MTIPLKILVADDTAINVIQIQAVARKLGHTVVSAADGIEAVRLFQSDPPDLVLMDIMMPRMDGLEALRRIRQLPTAHWTPIILFSALDSVEAIVTGLETGADDYLTKPLNLLLLRAKLNSYARVLALQQQLQESVAELGAWREEAAEQGRLGQFVIERLVHSDGLHDPMLKWNSIPARTFSGDLVCSARAPGDVLYLMLADAVGHGLPAALTALPLTQVFYSMARKGFPIASIAEELNGKLKAIIPVDRFVATTLAAVDACNRSIEVWNGGNPDALLVSADGGIAHRWPSRHPPLGILTDGDFSSTTETMHYLDTGELVLMSDGVIEAENSDGHRLGLDGVEVLLGASPEGQRFAALGEAIAAHLGGRLDHDDISWLVARAGVAPRPDVRIAQAAHLTRRQATEWRMDLSWGIAELRSIDVVPAVLGFASQIPALKAHQETLFVIIAELFNNALEHGVLELSSNIKNQSGGLERYLEERSRRLAATGRGRIDMTLHVHAIGGEPVLDIDVADSGPGFDFLPYLDVADDADSVHRVHGRGIRLVRSLCTELSYTLPGNRVHARYRL